MRTIYLDHAATTPISPEVKVAIIEVLEQQLGNASALHTPGQQAKQIIKGARESVAELIGAEPTEILFTSGGSESNNTIIHTYENQNIAISPLEHPSITSPAQKLAKNCQILPLLPLEDADSSADVFSAKNLPPMTLEPLKLAQNTALVSIMLANNETGQLFDIKNLASSAHHQGAKFHTDATQAIGKIPIDVRELNVDYLTFSAHKIGGPLGIGVLYHKKGAPLEPLILGGHQENNLRAGTESIPALAGLAVAAKIAKTTPEKYAKIIAPLRNKLAKKLLEIPGANLNTPSQEAELFKKGLVLPNILNISFQAAEGESIQLYLDAEGIIVSTGSACATGDIKPSPVLMALANDAERAHSSIRLSLGLDTTEQDIETVANSIKKIVTRLQQISTINQKGD